MRTTIELSNDLRSRLLALAARRGEKGFSHLVREAVERYLGEEEEHLAPTREAVAAIGSLNEEQAERMRESIRSLRAT